MATEARLDRVEHELEAVRERLRRLEREWEEEVAHEAPPPIPAPPPRITNPTPNLRPHSEMQQPLPKPRVLATAPRDSRAALDMEELFGGRVLAWIGGLAILFAAVLFVGMAMSNGWIDEETRTLIAAFASLGLFAGGFWLHERQGKTEAARVAVASALAGLYATIVVATQAYDLVPSDVGLVLAAVVGLAGFAVALQWDAPVIAAVGGLGALAAPVLVGLGVEGISPAFVAVALAANVLILIWRRWDWLALGAFVVSAPQLIFWVNDVVWSNPEGGTATTPLLVLVGFWILYVLAAAGYELRIRDRAEPLFPAASWIVLFAGAALVVLLGYQVLEHYDEHTAAVIWLFGFAGIHVALGELAIRFRVHREIGALLIGLGIVVTAFGLGQALDGPALVAGWAAGAVALAALSRRVDGSPDPNVSGRDRLLLASGGFLGLAIFHTLSIEAPPNALFEGVENLAEALEAIGACAVAALALGYFLRRDDSPLAVHATLLGGASLVYLGSVAIVDTWAIGPTGEVVQSGQTWLSAFWTVTGLGAVVFGLIRRNGNVRLAGLGLLGVAIAKVWTYDLSELEQLARVLSFVGLGLLLLAGAFAYQRIKPGSGEEADGDAERAPEVTPGSGPGAAR
jgi:uncharacterized membrane protein